MGKSLVPVWNSLEWIAEKLWEWPTTALGGTVIYAAGIGALYGDDYVIAAGLFFIGIAWIAGKAVSWEETRIHPHGRLIGVFFLLIGAALFISSLLWIRHRAREVAAKKTVSSQTLLPVELSMSCSSTDLPVHIRQDNPIEIMWLNQRLTHNRKGHEFTGFLTLENDGSEDYSWPPEKSKRKDAHSALQAYRCTLQNTGPSNLAEILMAAKIYYGDNHDDDFDPRYFEINPLPAGGRYSFYIVNQCPVSATAIIGDSAVLRVVGESERRTVPVSLSGANPIGNILMFFPSNYLWHPCSVEDDNMMKGNTKPPQK
jgi:hypothetical protein